MTDTTPIVKASIMIRQAAPDVWEHVALALREVAAHAAADMVKCPPELLLKAQGMAIMANEISSVFLAAPQNHDKLRQVRRNG